MCGRFALTLPRQAVTEHFRALAAAGPDPGPRADIRPTQPIDVIHLREGARQLAPMRWGFLPHWYRSPGDGPLIINARSEEIAAKPAFRQAVRETRCLVPATGFYEWAPGGAPGPERVHWLEPAAGGLFAMAGVWRPWRDEAGVVTATCAIVTCQANAALAPVHHRMPVVILPRDYGLWLGEEGPGAARLMRPAPEDFFRIEPGRGPPAQPRNRATSRTIPSQSGGA